MTSSLMVKRLSPARLWATHSYTPAWCTVTISMMNECMPFSHTSILWVALPRPVALGTLGVRVMVERMGMPGRGAEKGGEVGEGRKEEEEGGRKRKRRRERGEGRKEEGEGGGGAEMEEEGGRGGGGAADEAGAEVGELRPEEEGDTLLIPLGWPWIWGRPEDWVWERVWLRFRDWVWIWDRDWDWVAAWLRDMDTWELWLESKLRLSHCVRTVEDLAAGGLAGAAGRQALGALIAGRLEAGLGLDEVAWPLLKPLGGKALGVKVGRVWARGRALVTEEKEEEEDWAIGSGECPPVTFDPLSSAGSPPRRVLDEGVLGALDVLICGARRGPGRRCSLLQDGLRKTGPEMETETGES
ncbi:LOW QUALITY PROTEIN: hypothetical protein CRUP_024936 [Coryphaenoides rupestris]|nr:LOW QUALITY PROTEIN: hypothetical protein CRUP_024936 [Coryphaenoides rupestris]